MWQVLNTMPFFSKVRYSDTEKVIFFIYVLLLISVVFSMRAISSICLPLLIIASFVYNKQEKGKYLDHRLLNTFSIGCFILFLIQAAGLLYTTDLKEGILVLSLKAGIPVIPFAICCSSFLNARSFPSLMFAFVHIVLLGMLYCLGYSSYQYLVNNADRSVFFYHRLVASALDHAIYFSLLAFAGYIYLLETLLKKKFFYNRIAHLGIIFFFLFFIILLSSKLIIIYSLLYTIVATGMFSGKFKAANKRSYYLIFGLLIIAAGLLFFTNNPIQKRYKDITHGSIYRVFEDHKFTQNDYLNGVQFRLLQWRFAWEILTEKNAWLLGVSIGDAQHLLDKKYLETGLYVGDGHENRGFLGYNTHNQFLECFLQSGIAGLLAFCLLYFGLIQMMLRRKNYLVSGIVVLLLLYTFSEAYLETQYGIFIAIFLPLYFYYGTEGSGSTSEDQ